LFLWLTLNFPNLCISVYTYTATGGAAPARRGSCASCAGV